MSLFASFIIFINGEVFYNKRQMPSSIHYPSKMSYSRDNTLKLPSPMSELSEPNVKLHCSGNWDSILQALYIDLFNLIVESRIPGINERGYGDGSHCPPILGPNLHLCDLSKPECQKHQRLVHHLLRAVRHNIFEIEVLMLPDCCSESKPRERIQNKEYILLERWSMRCIHGSKATSTIEVSELLRAVRSFLHFSQISAWLSSTKGKSPTNICYWVKPTSDASSTQFESMPEIHSFPVFKINDVLCGSVKVNYPTRKQYIPIIPCSKHPPLHGLTFRTITNDLNLTTNVPLKPQLVKQLQKNCDNQQTVLNVNHCTSDPEPLVVRPASVLKTVTYNVTDVNIANRILKHSNSRTANQNILNSLSSSSCELLSTKRNIVSPNSDSTYECNYRDSYSKCASQKNLCLSKNSIAAHFSRKESKFSVISDLHPPLCKINTTTIEMPHQYLPEQSAPKNCDVPSECSNSDLYITSNATNILLHTLETSHDVSRTLYDCQSLQSLQNKSENSLNSLKRKKIDAGGDIHIIPGKRRRCVINKSHKLLKFTSKEFLQPSLFCQENTNKKIRKRYLPTSSKCKKVQIKSKECIKEDVGAPKEYNLLKNTTVRNWTILPTTIFKNAKSTNISTENDLDSSLNNEINNEMGNVHKKTNYVETKDNYIDKELPVSSYAKQIFCTNKISDSDLNDDDFSKNYKCKSSDLQLTSAKDMLKNTKAIALKKIVKSILPSTNSANVYKNFVAESIYSQAPSTSAFTSKLNRSLKMKQNKKCSNTAKQKLKKGLKDNLHAMINGVPIHEPFQNKSILNTPLQTLKTFSMISDSLFIDTSKSNPQARELNLKHYANAVLKFQNSCSLKQLKVCEINKSEVLPLNSVNEKNVNAVNSVLAVPNTNIIMNYQSSCQLSEFREVPKQLSSYTQNKCLKQLCPKLLVSYEMEKNKNAESNQTLPVSEITISTDKQPLTNENVTQFSSHTYSNCQLLDENSPISLVCNEHIPKEGISENLITSSVDASFLKSMFPEGRLSKSIQIEKFDQECKINYNQGVISTYMQASSPSGDKRASKGNIQGPKSFSTVVHQKTPRYLDCFPRHKLKFARGKQLLGNFEESILKGCLPPVNSVKGFQAEIGASGSFCPNHITLPADVSFYELDSLHSGATPYMAHVSLGETEYYLPKKGAVQVTLFNPSETVVKMFVLNYDLSDMPPMCHTFMRQKTYYMPVGSTEESPSSQKWLRFILHLRFASSKTGKVYLHEDFKIIVLNKSNDDAASEFSQEPCELRSFLHVPMNPTFSNF